MLRLYILVIYGLGIKNVLRELILFWLLFYNLFEIGVNTNAKNRDLNIRKTNTFDTTVHFIGITIANEDGRVGTTLDHKPSTEPYILPYTSDHSVHIRRNIQYAALSRSTRICSDVEDFNRENIRIDMSLLLNKYPPSFIREQFNRFYEINNTMLVLNQMNQQIYNLLQFYFNLSQIHKNQLNIQRWN